MRLCGTPDDEFMNRITSQEARNYIRTVQLMEKKNFKHEFKNANEHGTIGFFITIIIIIFIILFLAVDLLEKMLELDYEKR